MKLFGITSHKDLRKIRNGLYTKVMQESNIDCWTNNNGDCVIGLGDNQCGIVDLDGEFGGSDIAQQYIYSKLRFYSLLDFVRTTSTMFFNLDSTKIYNDGGALTEYTVGDVYTKAPKGRSIKDLVDHNEFIDKLSQNFKKISSSALHNAITKIISLNPSPIVVISDLVDQVDVNFVKENGGKIISFDDINISDVDVDLQLDSEFESHAINTIWDFLQA